METNILDAPGWFIRGNQSVYGLYLIFEGKEIHFLSSTDLKILENYAKNPRSLLDTYLKPYMHDGRDKILERYIASKTKQVLSCDCGAIKANTTHAGWCSVKDVEVNNVH